MDQSPTINSIDLTELARETMLEHKLLPDYPQAAIEQVSHYENPYLPTGSAKDLRNKLFFSIDNDDSKDLDQLTYAEALPNGGWKIFVAIADVDSLVKKDSPVDKYAQNNTVSVYTPTKVFAMLPAKLSNDLTSLNEDRDRTAIVTEVEIAPDGTVGYHNWIYQAIVRNHAKLAYNGLSAWLDDKTPPPSPLIDSIPGLRDQIKLQDAIMSVLRKRRYEEGSLTFETIEAIPVVKNDKVVDIKEAVINRARNLIEEFMIAANTAVSRFLKANHLPSLRRVVRTPKRWDRIVTIAAEHGAALPSEPDSKALNQFLLEQRRLDPEHFPDLSLMMIKLLGRGEYIVEKPGEPPIGHFNLAIKDYTHSTAPNRRFPDLITQRIIKSVLFNLLTPYSLQELLNLADHCTEKSVEADKVERRMRKSAVILLLYSKLNQVFSAIVTGSNAKGTWVRIKNPPAEGKLIKGFENVDVGDKIQVKLVHLDIKLGHIDFVRQ